MRQSTLNWWPRCGIATLSDLGPSLSSHIFAVFSRKGEVSALEIPGWNSWVLICWFISLGLGTA